MIVHTHFFPGAGSKARLSLIPVHKIVKTVLMSEKKSASGEINVIYVDKKRIRRLNRQFLDTSTDTDVIAFPYEPEKGRSRKIMGDIYICVPVARSNSKRFNEPFSREVTRLVVHGTLHLLGYADHPEHARKKMWVRQEPLVEALWTH